MIVCLLSSFFPLGHGDLSSGQHQCVVCHSVASTSEPCWPACADRHGSLGVARVVRVSLHRVLIEVCCDLWA